jgi:hypothetical protein
VLAAGGAQRNTGHSTAGHSTVQCSELGWFRCRANRQGADARKASDAVAATRLPSQCAFIRSYVAKQVSLLPKLATPPHGMCTTLRNTTPAHTSQPCTHPHPLQHLATSAASHAAPVYVSMGTSPSAMVAAPDHTPLKSYCVSGSRAGGSQVQWARSLLTTWPQKGAPACSMCNVCSRWVVPPLLLTLVTKKMPCRPVPRAYLRCELGVRQ